MTAPSLPPELRAKVLDAVRREPAPPRPVASRAAAVKLAAGFAALLGIFAVLGGADLKTRPSAFLISTVVGWALIAVVATWGGAFRGRSMLGRSAPVLVAVALATGPLLFAVMFVGTTMWPGTVGYAAPMRLHLACLAATLAMAVGPLVALGLVRRGSDPVHPRLSGAALGATAGAWAGVMIDLHCPVSDAIHVGLGHVLPVLALAVLGAFAGKRALGLAPFGSGGT